MTVAIVDAYDDPSAESDLTAYRSTYGLPPCTTSNGCLRKMNQDGNVTPLPPPDVGWAGEISLDLDMVSAICPGCRILLLESPQPSLAALGAGVNTAVRMGARFVSNSYGGPETGQEPNFDSAYYDHPGVVITASSGDNGYGVTYPASGRGVTAVGGTSLRRSNGPRGWAETAWSGAGSGCSTSVPQPPFQAGLSTGCAHRAEADVAAVADPQTGVAVYQTYTDSTTNPGWQVYGGTSAASPIIASVYALAGNPNPTDSPNAYPYAHALNLFDITIGNNGACGTPLCSAGPGYDGPTGLGSPNGTGAFTFPSANSGFVAVGPVRVLDTRTGTGAPPGQIGPGATLTLTLPNRPAGASAVVLNLTGTNLTNAAASYVSACPAAQPVPTCAQTSAINPSRGVTTANEITIPITTDGTIRLYNATGNIDLLADLTGYLTTGFVAVGPVRVLDTRTGTGAPPGQIGPGATLTLTLPNRPAGASAVVLNLTGTNLTNAAASYVSACPAAQPVPTCAQTSAINPSRGVTTANEITIPITTDGTIRLYNATGNIDLLADLTGYLTTS